MDKFALGLRLGFVWTVLFLMIVLGVPLMRYSVLSVPISGDTVTTFIQKDMSVSLSSAAPANLTASSGMPFRIVVDGTAVQSQKNPTVPPGLSSISYKEYHTLPPLPVKNGTLISFAAGEWVDLRIETPGSLMTVTPSFDKDFLRWAFEDFYGAGLLGVPIIVLYLLSWIVGSILITLLAAI